QPMGARSVKGPALFPQPFEPPLETPFVPYGDIQAMRQAVDARTAAVILDPIQGEGGIRLPPDDYLPAVRELCTVPGALLILDEVQTGLGRTGAMFGCNHSMVVPDVICLGKALSGGVIPCAAFHSTDEIWRAFHPNPFYHTSTFGANPMATAAAAATIETLQADNLVWHAAETGQYFLDKLTELAAQFPALIRDVRGRGLLIGMETADAARGEAIAARLFERNVLVAYTLNKPEVIRIEPPLIITRELVDEVLTRFADALKEESK